MSDAFLRMVRGEAASDEIRSELQGAADQGCPRCSGLGIELERAESPHKLNMNLYGFSVLRALGLPAEPTGTCTIAEARRALLRARNSNLGHLVVSEETTYGRPCADEDGTVQLRPLRSHMKGLSEAGLTRRIDDFETFVQRAAAAGATTIFWS